MTNVLSSTSFERTSARSLVEEVLSDYRSHHPEFGKRTVHNETNEDTIPVEHAKILRACLEESLSAFVEGQTLPENWDSVTNVCIYIPSRQEKNKTTYFIVLLDNHDTRLDPRFLDSALPYTNGLLERVDGKKDLIFNNGNHFSVHIQLNTHNVVSFA